MIKGYAKVKQRTGGLTEIAQPILDYLETKRKEKAQKDFYDNVVRLYNEFQSGVKNAPMEVDESKGTWETLSQTNTPSGAGNIFALPESPLTQTNQPSETGNIFALSGTQTTQPQQKEELPPLVDNPKLPEIPTPPIDDTTQDYILPDAKYNPKNRYEHAVRERDKFMQGFIGALLNPDVDKDWINKANLFTTLVEGQTKHLSPKQPSYQQVGKGSTLLAIGDDGVQVVYQGQEDNDPKYNLVENSKTGTYWYVTPDGKPYDTGVPYERKGGGRSGSGDSRGRDDGSTYGDDGYTYGDYSSRLGEINNAIKKIRAEFYGDDGNLWRAEEVTDPNNSEKKVKLFYPPRQSPYYKEVDEAVKTGAKTFQIIKKPLGYTEEQYRMLKEKEKAEFVTKAEELITQQGLRLAAEEIWKYVKSSSDGNYQEKVDAAIRALKIKNPDINSEDEAILRQYFKFYGL